MVSEIAYGIFKVSNNSCYDVDTLRNYKNNESFFCLILTSQIINKVAGTAKFNCCDYANF